MIHVSIFRPYFRRGALGSLDQPLFGPRCHCLLPQGLLTYNLSNAKTSSQVNLFSLCRSERKLGACLFSHPKPSLASRARGELGTQASDHFC